MKILLIVCVLHLVSLGVFDVQAASDIPPPPCQGNEKNADKTDIYLLGAEPKDDKCINNVYEVDSNGKQRSAQAFTAGIGDTVIVHLSIDDQKRIHSSANCLESDGQEKRECPKKNIALYLNGRSIGERRHDDLLNANYIEFKLGYIEDKDYSNKQKWQELLGSPTWGKNFFEKPVSVIIGIANTANTSELVTVNNRDKFYLQRISGWKFLAGLLMLIVIVNAIFKYAPHTGLLRNGDVTTQWSLARCQMAFWFILIIYSFLFVWGITGALDTITPQTLVMMGLSAGTLLGSALIEVGRDDNMALDAISVYIKKYIAENTALTAQLAEAPSAALDALRNENERRIAALQTEIGKLSTAENTTGKFWSDILSDRSGSPALHRFQVVAWTLVLGIIFIFSVWKYLSMPSFSDNLLSLMGLSSATYLGFKVPENKS